MTGCVVCEEVITQPVCGACLGREVATWLAEKFPGRPELLGELARLSDEIVSDHDDSSCILCKRPMGTCAYCYTEHLFHWVRAEFPELVQEYLLHFSFDAHHAGYEALV